MQNPRLKIAALIAFLFGIVTIFVGGSVILDLFGMRAKEGKFVLSVVWPVSICGILYTFASYGFLKMKRWTITILNFALLLLFIAFILLLIQIFQHKPYETKTIFALTFRLILTLFLFWVARTIPKYDHIKNRDIDQI